VRFYALSITCMFHIITFSSRDTAYPPRSQSHLFKKKLFWQHLSIAMHVPHSLAVALAQPRSVNYIRNLSAHLPHPVTTQVSCYIRQVQSLYFSQNLKLIVALVLQLCLERVMHVLMKSLTTEQKLITLRDSEGVG